MGRISNKDKASRYDNRTGERTHCNLGHNLSVHGVPSIKTSRLMDGTKVERHFLRCQECNRISAKKSARKNGIGSDLGYAHRFETRFGFVR